MVTHDFCANVISMYYHFAILLLFRPFAKFHLVSSNISPQEMCSQASNAITAIVNSYSNLYTLRRTPSFVPFFVLSSSVFHLAMVEEDASNFYNKDLLIQNIESLRSMSGCHGFAAQALDIVQSLSYSNGRHNAADDNADTEPMHNLRQQSRIAADGISPILGGMSMMLNMELGHSTVMNPLSAFFSHGNLSLEHSDQLQEAGLEMIVDDE